jgi:hypothetical protein
MPGQEIDLLLSSSVPSPLIPALPFAFLTNDLHIVSPANLQNAQVPPHVQITKHFLKAHVEDIKAEFFRVKAMGSGATEEWIKGLDEQGKQKRVDASRWERWEANGGIQRMQNTERSEAHDVMRKSKSGIAIPLISTNDMARSLPGNFVSRFQGGINGSTPQGGFSTQPEQTTIAPSCKCWFIPRMARFVTIYTCTSN